MAATSPATLSTSGTAANPLRYDTLERGRNTIRVLSFNDATGESGASTGLLSCRLETVDLDEWTPRFDRFRSKMRSEYQQTFSASQLAVAQMDSMDISRWRLSAQLDSHSPTTERSYSFIDTPSDLYLADGKTFLEHRFSWGDYLALSYVWGDGVADHKIVINGHEFMVRSNLYHALCRLQKSDEVCKAHLRIWIDAICINQDDMAEREHEVPRMRTIYARALCVRAWLGTPPAELGETFASLCASLEHTLLWYIPAQEETEGRSDAIMSTTSAVLPASKADREQTNKEEDARVAFFSVSYWKRLWILQEVALAHSVVFWYGDFWLSPRQLYPLLDMVTKPDRRSNEQDMMMAGVCVTVEHLRRGRAVAAAEVGGLGFPRTAHYCATVVLLAGATNAADERDRVYGVLGLVSDSVARRIKVDYSPAVSSDDAYIQFSMACILAERNPAVRAGLDLSRRQAQRRVLPSWAFDLGKRAGYLQWLSYAVQRLHHEQQNAHEVTTIKFIQDSGRHILTCRGTVLDKITHDCDTFVHVLQNNDYRKPAASSISTDAPATVFTQRTRLETARVFLQDPCYEFEDGHSPLDIPWQVIEQFDLSGTGASLGIDQKLETHFIPLAPMLSAMYQCKDLPFETGRFQDLLPQERSESEMLEILWSLSKRKPSFIGGQMVMSKHGLFGSAPYQTLPGDTVCLLEGSQEPVILRWCEDRSAYMLIGSCFMDAVMIGRGHQWAEDRGLKETSIDIC